MTRLLLALGLALFFHSSALAAGTVQLVIHGKVHRDGGTPVEFVVEADGGETVFRGIVGRDTQAGDLVALLERRLKAAGIRHVRGSDAPGQGPVSLFVEDVERVRLRLGGGLRGTVTACDEAPRALRLLPSRLTDTSRGAHVMLGVTCASRDGSSLATHEVALDLADVATTAERVADLLARRASQDGLYSERPTDDAWATSGTSAGEGAIGLTVELYADGDWGVELELAPRISSR